MRICTPLALILAVSATFLAAPARSEPAIVTAKTVATSPAARPHQIRGFSVQLNDPNGAASYIKAVDELHEMGCTSINFVIAARQKNVRAETLHINYKNIPNPPEIEKILKYAKKKGMYVMLMPIVLLDEAGSKEWRGVIAPPDWDVWFESYNTYITNMARLGARCDVDLFCVGSELLSTETRRSNWTTVIRNVKAIYKGKLTYSANWDHYTVPTFWEQVDYIGMNNYNELSKSKGTDVDKLVKNWGPLKDNILKFVKEQDKPFFFTEVGWHNLENTLAEPWNYVADGKIDLAEQERAYKSFVGAWKDIGTSQYMGAFIWEWRPGAKPTDHGQYSLQGTPALEVVKEWMKGQAPNGKK